MLKHLACVLLATATACGGSGGSPLAQDAGISAAARWDGSSHISDGGAVYDSTWVFALDGEGQYQVSPTT